MGNIGFAEFLADGGKAELGIEPHRPRLGVQLEARIALVYLW